MARLEVTVVEAKNLLQQDKLRKNNSSTRIHLGKQIGKTRVTEKSNDPEWNEVFVFDHFKKQDILHVTVYAEENSKNRIIGSLQIKLHSLFKKGRIDEWYHIPAKVGLACCGQVHLILKYIKDEA